jgi:hypothetical protein
LNPRENIIHMKITSFPAFWAFSLALLLCVSPVSALVNPALQPNDLTDRHRVVLSARLVEVDDENLQLTFEVADVLKGEFPAKRFTVTTGNPATDEVDDAPMQFMPPGQTVVAWIGKTRQQGAVLMYAGNRDWYELEIPDPQDNTRWRFSKLAPEVMVGTFNGQSERLVEMLKDSALGRYFFPAQVFARFQPDRVLATFDGPVRGVALHDVNGDGRLDALAATPRGVRLFLQLETGDFEDASEAWGLDGVTGHSLGLADVTLNGRPDLLVDATLYLNEGQRFTRSGALDVRTEKPLKAAVFAELNGDGYPDVLVSLAGGGLRAFLHPGAPGLAEGFSEATARLGLDQERAGAGGDGFVVPGDWNLDGRMDLFYASNRGHLLIQGDDGVFAPVPTQTQMDFRAGPELAPGLTGAGGFAPVWREERMDLLVPMDNNYILITREDASVLDVTGQGNEIALAAASQIATLLEDLDMDGHVDLFTLSRDPGAANSYHTNRGYGSFMKPELYYGEFWPGPSLNTGAGGAASGDVNGNGANDLLIGGLDGRLTLVLSDALGLRQPKEHPLYHERILQQTALLKVGVGGPLGVLGATVRLTDAQDRVVALRSIGTQVLTGCRGPDEVNLAIRHPGPHRLTVRYADGHVVTRDLTLEAGQTLTHRVER